MTVTQKPARKIISGAGWTNPLQFDIYIESAADVEVWADDQQLALGVDYNVYDIGNPNGFTVDITVPGNWNPDEWVLLHVPPINQNADLSMGGSFGEAYESAADAIIRRMQSLKDGVDRAWKVPIQDEDGPAPNINRIPEGHFWKADADGNMIDGGSSADIENAQANAAAAAQSAQDALDEANRAETEADRAEAAAASIDLPTPVADTFLHRKNDNSGYEALSPAQTRAVLSAPPHLPTRAAIKSLIPTAGATVILTEAGREGTFVFRTGNYSAQKDADTQEGIYLAPDSDPTGASGVWVRQYVGLADVRWFGAALDDTANDTVPFNVALAVAKDVFFPEGRAYITDKIQVPNDGNLIGESVARSVFSVKSDFNLTAEAVVKMGTSENMAFIDRIGFEFEQPDSDVRADMIQYPFAVGHRNIPRVRIGHIRISRGWDGVDASQNAGGATYDWIECGTLNRGLFIDGALDTMNIGRFRVWPFGMVAASGIGLVYRDDTNVAAEIGKCDGLEGEIHAFRARVYFNTNGASSAGRHLHALHLDGDGARLHVDSGVVDIDYCYYTKSDYTPANHGFIVQGASTRVTIGILDISSAENRELMRVVNGSLSIGQGRFNFTSTDWRAVLQTGGKLTIDAMEFTAPGARTVSFIRSEGGELNIGDNCRFPDNGGTGTGIEVTSSSVTGRIGDIPLNGRKLVVNSSAMIGSIGVSEKGYFSGDAATTVRLPDGWSISRVSAGNYLLTHNLGWPVERQHVSAIAHVSSHDTTIAVDSANTTDNQLRLRTMVGGTLTDMAVSLSLQHI